MPKAKSAPQGADWTGLLSDPDLLVHLGELLQTYRDAPVETRDEALLEVMRKIKRSVPKAPQAASKKEAAEKETGGAGKQAEPAPELTTPVPVALPVALPASSTPPFEPSIFAPSWGQDRRRYPRMKCFVVVELRVTGSSGPIWGNLSNASLGGCLVETPAIIASGANIEIGLWVTSGQIWVKGFILNGVVARTNPSSGIRVKFAEMNTTERENLRHFLKFVETTTKTHAIDHGYLAQMKR